ncbi:hypothetical protein SDC9_85986 [bioreactor metagenome]|uniref:Uncharacterized protein n=1 Tax=bioreactor metagenome TaxID=1076179 RepID=A0A644ZKZ0_9ZZZZ
MVEGEPQLQQESALEDPGRDAGVPGGGTDGTEQDGVVLGERLHLGLGQHLSGAQPAVGAEVVVDLVEGIRTGHGVEDLEALSDDLGTDAVAGDHSDGRAISRVLSRHGVRLAGRRVHGAGSHEPMRRDLLTRGRRAPTG